MSMQAFAESRAAFVGQRALRRLLTLLKWKQLSVSLNANSGLPATCLEPTFTTHELLLVSSSYTTQSRSYNCLLDIVEWLLDESGSLLLKRPAVILPFGHSFDDARLRPVAAVLRSIICTHPKLGSIHSLESALWSRRMVGLIRIGRAALGARMKADRSVHCLLNAKLSLLGQATVHLRN